MFLKLTLKEEQNVFFQSDLHINHKNICRGTTTWDKGCRDFDTLKEMEDTIVANHNSVVKPGDFVFNLGDVIFGDKTYLPTFLAKLFTKNIYLIRGNHDTYLEKYPEFKDLFLGVYEYLEVCICRPNLPKRNFVLFHYPIASWNGMGGKNPSIHLNGHCHGNMKDNPNLRRLDVGVDVDLYGHRKFFPFSLDEIENIMYNVKGPFTSQDHHI